MNAALLGFFQGLGLLVLSSFAAVLFLGVQGQLVKAVQKGAA